MSVDELIDEARLIVLQPGDLLVLSFPIDCTAEQAATVKDKLRQYAALRDHEIVVLGGGADLAVIRPAK